MDDDRFAGAIRDAFAAKEHAIDTAIATRGERDTAVFDELRISEREPSSRQGTGLAALLVSACALILVVGVVAAIVVVGRHASTTTPAASSGSASTSPSVDPSPVSSSESPGQALLWNVISEDAAQYGVTLTSAHAVLTTDTQAYAVLTGGGSSSTASGDHVWLIQADAGRTFKCPCNAQSPRYMIVAIKENAKHPFAAGTFEKAADLMSLGDVTTLYPPPG